MADVVVVGSANVDLVLGVKRNPRPGETVLATGLSRGPGGKGTNQAVAAARAGARTAIVAALGADDGATLLREVLHDAGVDLSLVTTTDSPTGTAVITVAEDGENSIVVAASANAELTLTGQAEAAVRQAKIVLSQLEIPFETVQAAAAASSYFVLNAAPAAELSDQLLSHVDLLVVNETEAETLAGGAGNGGLSSPMVTRVPARGDADWSALLKRVPAAIVTLGADGAVILVRDAAETHVPGVPAEVVDTTAAGDTFCGYLAATLSSGRGSGPITAGDLTNAVRRATVAAALSVQVAGAAGSVPHGDAVDARSAEVYR